MLDFRPFVRKRRLQQPGKFLRVGIGVVLFPEGAVIPQDGFFAPD